MVSKKCAENENFIAVYETQAARYCGPLLSAMAKFLDF